MYRVSESSGGDGAGYVPGADGTGMMAHCGPHEGYSTRGEVLRGEWEEVRRIEDGIGGYMVLLWLRKGKEGAFVSN